jgi:hypothetical protein
MRANTPSWLKRCQCGGMVCMACRLVVRNSMPITVMACASVLACMGNEGEETGGVKTVMALSCVELNMA